jgi:hypothetical protein
LAPILLGVVWPSFSGHFLTAVQGTAQTFVSNGSAENLSWVHDLDGSNTGLIFDIHKYLDSDNYETPLECTSNHISDTFMPLQRS